MFMYVCIYIYIYIYVCVCVFACVCIYVVLCVYVRTYARTPIRAYVCTHVLRAPYIPIPGSTPRHPARAHSRNQLKRRAACARPAEPRAEDSAAYTEDDLYEDAGQRASKAMEVLVRQSTGNTRFSAM